MTLSIINTPSGWRWVVVLVGLPVAINYQTEFRTLELLELALSEAHLTIDRSTIVLKGQN